MTALTILTALVPQPSRPPAEASVASKIGHVPIIYLNIFQ